MLAIQAKRCIARYGGSLSGPLLISVGALHGNERAGVDAIRTLKKMLTVEPITNPSFCYKGAFVGLIGNQRAYAENRRYITQDLNRIWTPKGIKKAKQSISKTEEEGEMLDIIKQIKKEVSRYKPTEVVILDLHTTSSAGGIFTIAAPEPRSIHIGAALYAPEIIGMLEDVKGTMLQYYSKKYIQGIKISGVVFEAGQHEDPFSVNRAIAAIVNCMKAIGSVRSEDVENIHNDILINYSKDLPKQSKLIYKHKISPKDGFMMLPGFQNFQPVKKGTWLAHDAKGKVLAPYSGYLLMPLYQNQGSEGFYLIRSIDE